MKHIALTHLSDHALHQGLVASLAHESASTVTVVAHIAEFERRRLYVPAGYAWMIDYCVAELHMSRDSAFKRIRAARAARRFPILFEALADRRLHLTAVVLLAPYFTRANIHEVIEAATHRTKRAVQALIAQRFPEADIGVKFTIGERDHDLLRHVPREVPSGNVAEIFVRGLHELARRLEKAKFAATDRPHRRSNCPAATSRHIPAAVKRSVWARDGEQCTFVNARRSARRSRARRTGFLFGDRLRVSPASLLPMVEVRNTA